MRGAAFSDPVFLWLGPIVFIASGTYLIDKGMKTGSAGLMCVGAFLALAGITLLVRWFNSTRNNRLK
jgi:hypothetical protein